MVVMVLLIKANVIRTLINCPLLLDDEKTYDEHIKELTQL